MKPQVKEQIKDIRHSYSLAEVNQIDSNIDWKFIFSFAPGL